MIFEAALQPFLVVLLETDRNDLPNCPISQQGRSWPRDPGQWLFFLKPPFHWIALCLCSWHLRSWQSWRFVKISQIATEASAAAETRDLCPFSTFLIRSCYAGHDAAVVLLPFCCAWGPTWRPPRRFYYTATMAKDFKLCSIYAQSTITTMRLRSCYDLSARAALMLRFGTAST